MMDIGTDSPLVERYRNIIPVTAMDGEVKLAGEPLAYPSTIKDVWRKGCLLNELGTMSRSQIR